MRTFRLARIAAEAEAVRLRHRARRAAIRAVCAVVAIIFLAGALVFAHVAAWYWLRQCWEARYVGLAFAGADVLLAILFGLLAIRSSPGRIETEALEVRRRALEGASASVAWSSLAVQVLRMAGRLLARRRN